MKLLNPGYTGTGGSLYWNSGSGSCYSGQNNAVVSCNFANIGLKNDVTRNMISEEVWYLRSSNGSYADLAYTNERISGDVRSGTKTTWAGKVAILYPSDYGYAADFNKCNQRLYNYNDTTCTGNNWMKTIITNGGYGGGWLLTPYTGFSYRSWVVRKAGNVGGSNVLSDMVYIAEVVIPTLYLEQSVEVKDGNDGSINNPYQIVVD